MHPAPPHPDVYAGLASAELATHPDAIRTFLAPCFHVQPDGATFSRLEYGAAIASWSMTRTTPDDGGACEYWAAACAFPRRAGALQP